MKKICRSARDAEIHESAKTVLAFMALIIVAMYFFGSLVPWLFRQ